MVAGKCRLFFVNRYFFPDESATSQLLADLAFELAHSGREVHVICSRQLYGAAGTRLAAHEIIDGVVVHRLWTTRFGRRQLFGRALDYLSFYLTCAIALLRLLRRSDIIVAETDPPLISVVAAAAARLKGAILVNWLQDVFPEIASILGASPPAFLERMLRRLRDASLRAAACNVVLGQRMLERLRQTGLPAGGLRIIENWADADTLQPKPAADSALRAHLGLSGKFVVGYSGNLGRAHEIETLIGAAELLRGDDGIAFLFIGGGAKMDELRSEVAARQLPRFHFLPYQPRETLHDSLAAPDVHLVNLIPALEGLIVPSKFYGILAAGRPVAFVGDTDGELARVIARSNCGLVVGAGDTAGLAQAFRALKADVRARQNMGAAARELLCSRFSRRHAITAWASLLNDVLPEA
jgi:glycosyltransferase involved in cell wall biosynthesis